AGDSRHGVLGSAPTVQRVRSIQYERVELIRRPCCAAILRELLAGISNRWIQGRGSRHAVEWGRAAVEPCAAIGGLDVPVGARGRRPGRGHAWSVSEDSQLYYLRYGGNEHRRLPGFGPAAGNRHAGRAQWAYHRAAHV